MVKPKTAWKVSTWSGSIPQPGNWEQKDICIYKMALGKLVCHRESGVAGGTVFINWQWEYRFVSAVRVMTV